MGRFKTTEERLAKKAAKHGGIQMSSTTESTETKETVKPDPATAERHRLVGLLFNKSQGMILEYKTVIKHTGSLLTESMGYAYSKAINDVIKLLLKEKTNEEPVQKEG